MTIKEARELKKDIDMEGWADEDDVLELIKLVERLKQKYEEPGQKCNRGHKNHLPVSLWDCPICTERLRKENKWLVDECARPYVHTGTIATMERAIEILTDNMQQALEETTNADRRKNESVSDATED